MSEWTVRRCEQCGHATPEKGAFCCTCGAGESSYPLKVKDQRCEKCGEDYLKHLLVCPFCGHGWDEPYPSYIPTIDEMAGLLSPKPDTSLSLLVIDLGDSCVVKVESGELHGLEQYFPDTVMGSRLSNIPFSQLRDAIDSQDKPVPRIERLEEQHRYVLHYDNPALTADDSEINLMNGGYDALSEIAGKPLPIYESGTWKQIGDANVTWCPVAIWRYCRQ